MRIFKLHKTYRFDVTQDEAKKMADLFGAVANCPFKCSVNGVFDDDEWEHDEDIGIEISAEESK